MATSTIMSIPHITKVTETITAGSSTADKTVDMPNGYTHDNSVIIGFGYSLTDDYRHGNNVLGSSNERVFAKLISPNKIMITSNYNGTVKVEVILGRIG